MEDERAKPFVPPEPERPFEPRDDVRAAASPVRCPFCHSDVSPTALDWVACRACLARHHAACWKESGFCASCRSTDRLVGEPPVRAPRKGTSVLTKITQTAKLLGLVLAVIATVQLARSSKEPIEKPPEPKPPIVVETSKPIDPETGDASDELSRRIARDVKGVLIARDGFAWHPVNAKGVPTVESIVPAREILTVGYEPSAGTSWLHVRMQATSAVWLFPELATKPEIGAKVEIVLEGQILKGSVGGYQLDGQKLTSVLFTFPLSASHEKLARAIEDSLREGEEVMESEKERPKKPFLPPEPVPPAGAREDVRAAVSPVRCPYCHTDVSPDARDWVACRKCLARHHAGCWQESGACASCRGTESLIGATPAAPRSSSRLFLLLLGYSLFVLVAIGVAIAFMGSPRSRVETAPPKASTLVSEKAVAPEKAPPVLEAPPAADTFVPRLALKLADPGRTREEKVVRGGVLRNDMQIRLKVCARSPWKIPEDLESIRRFRPDEVPLSLPANASPEDVERIRSLLRETRDAHLGLGGSDELVSADEVIAVRRDYPDGPPELHVVVTRPAHTRVAKLLAAGPRDAVLRVDGKVVAATSITIGPAPDPLPHMEAIGSFSLKGSGRDLDEDQVRWIVEALMPYPGPVVVEDVQAGKRPAR